MADWILTAAEWLGPLGAVISAVLLWLWKRNRPRKPAKVTFVPPRPTPAVRPREVAEADADTRSVIVDAGAALDEAPRDVEDWTDAGDDTAVRGR